MIRSPSRDFQARVVSLGAAGQPGVVYDQLTSPPRASWHRLVKILRLASRRYSNLVWTPQSRALAAKHREIDHAFITAHELRLLPFAVASFIVAGLVATVRRFQP